MWTPIPPFPSLAFCSLTICFVGGKLESLQCQLEETREETIIIEKKPVETKTKRKK